MLDGGEYCTSEMEVSEGDADCLDGFEFNTNSSKKKSKIKRRFSDEQIKSLESTFESESKLEQRKKLQLARELGLQPRQVAIWFQNKRARWKSKQIEREYNKLRSNYDSLASQFESLKKEKQLLVVQSKKLHDLMEKSGEESQSQCCKQELTRVGDNSDNVNYSTVDEVKPSCSLSEQGQYRVFLDDDIVNDSSVKTEYFGLEEEHEHDQLVNMVEEPADGSLTSPENWEGLDSTGLLQDQSSTESTSYQWWNFWS